MNLQASPFQLKKDARFQGRHFLHLAGLIYCVVGTILNASAQQATSATEPDSNGIVEKSTFKDDWTQHISLGALVGLNISAKFSENGSFNIPGNAGSGIYNDGYVLEDQTGNAGGYTGYWGYDNASQYNATAQTLSMHDTTSYSAADNSGKNSAALPGLELGYGQNLWDWKRTHIGWDAGVGVVAISIDNNYSAPATVNQTTYVYDTGGIVMPDAPYQGGPSGQGEPIIPATPSSTSSQTSTGVVTGRRSLDGVLTTIRLGPSVNWDLNRHITTSLSAGPAVGIVVGEYKYNETITAGGASAQNSGSFVNTAVSFGGYVKASLMYYIWDGGDADIFVSAEYMPMKNATIEDGGQEAQLNLSGQVYLSAGINWPF
jgi:hypothetical protein